MVMVTMLSPGKALGVIAELKLKSWEKVSFWGTSHASLWCGGGYPSGGLSLLFTGLLAPSCPGATPRDAMTEFHFPPPPPPPPPPPTKCAGRGPLAGSESPIRVPILGLAVKSPPPSDSRSPFRGWLESRRSPEGKYWGGKVSGAALQLVLMRLLLALPWTLAAAEPVPEPGGGRVEGRLRQRGSECCWICCVKLRLSAGTVCTVANEWHVDEDVVCELWMEWKRSAVDAGEQDADAEDAG